MSSAADPDPDAAHAPQRPSEPARRPSADPPPAKPPRGALTVRDMLVALAVLALLVLAVAGASRSCTFSPGGPSVDASRLPVVDAPAELRALAPLVPFAVRIPAVPPGWRANSVGQDRVGDSGDGRAVRTGFLTPEGRYLRLLQSDAPEPALLAVETGARPVSARGAVDVGGQPFVVYGEPRDEPIWTADVPGPAPVRLLITGSGTEDDFRALAAAALTGEQV